MGNACEYCGKEGQVDSCVRVPVKIDGKEYEPVKFGDDGRCHAPGDRCYDCAVANSGYHHPGCDAERCPKCGGQLISCGCLDEPEAT
jgi:hypothetical protein